MSEENQIEELLKEIPEEVQNLHMIAILLAQQMVEGEGAEEIAPFEPDFIEALKEWLVERADEDSEDFIAAYHTIASFAAGNEQLGPRMALQIKALLESPEVDGKLKQWQVSADPEEVRRVADNFGAFTGQGSAKTAPKVGEEKPEGALDLNALNFPKRL